MLEEQRRRPVCVEQNEQGGREEGKEGGGDRGGQAGPGGLRGFGLLPPGRWNRTMLRVETWTQVGRDQGEAVPVQVLAEYSHKPLEMVKLARFYIC